MQTIYRQADAEGIAFAAKLLQQGQVFALPTETVYGIAADARNQDAVAKIFVAKGRPQDNPLIVHVSGLDGLDGIVREIPEQAELLAHAFWPGPLTMILPRGTQVAEGCCAGLDSVGVRMPNHPVAQAIIAQSGCAFAAPSANLSGSPSPTTAQDVLADMEGRLPLVLEGGDCQVGVESTVISLIGTQPMLLRPGYVTLEQLEVALGEPIAVSGAILEALQEGEEACSPGMKYKHYAPSADVTILEGNFAAFAAYIAEHAEEKMACLCFTGEEAILDVPCVVYGKEKDGADQAKHLFRALRALDEGKYHTVYARCPQKDGVSMAVYNRLVRAANFRVVQL
ncbi:MAG: L-threonylcarbamoyladenylate synthase [Faecalibacterium sp.]